MRMDELLGYAANRSLVRIQRKHPSDPDIRGYVLRASEVLCLLRPLHDFIPDGYAVIRNSSIMTIDRHKNDEFWERVMVREGLAHDPETEEKIDLRSMKRAVLSAHNAFGRLIIECEDEDEDIQDFYIGSLVNIDDETLRFDHFDTCGRWEREPSRIEIDDISKIQIETPYCKTFWKYLERGAPNASNAHPAG